LRSILEELNLQVIRLLAAWFEKKTTGASFCIFLCISVPLLLVKEIEIFRHNWTCKFELNFFCYFFNNYCRICDHFGHVINFFSEVILTKNLSVRAARSAVFGALHHINY